MRSKAGEWNIDKKRIGATGGSAGGCSSLWLAFHDDMADFAEFALQILRKKFSPR